MGVEIERKFLVDGSTWRSAATRSECMAQGYLAGPPAARCSVRVRIADAAAFLNIKSVALGIERDEYEYPIPREDADRMLATLAGERVEKIRHYADIDGHLFEIDEFLGDNAGLIVALSSDAPIALVPADFAAANPIGLVTFVVTLVALYAWALKRNHAQT